MEEQIVLNTFTLGLLGACGTALCGTITALWLALNGERKAHNDTRDKMQDKIDALTTKAIEAVNSAVNQANSTSALLVSVKEVVAKLESNIQQLREQLLTGRGRRGGE